MLYTTLLAASAVFSGLVAAQNSTSNLQLPNGIQPCCKVDANRVPQNQRSTWCNAQQNTCPEICGGQGQIAAGGNNCDDNDLTFTCKCRNGTEPDMSEYQQSVPGQMCRFWFSLCTNATIDQQTNEGSESLQFSCDTIMQERCGNKTTQDASETSSAASSSTPRPTGGSSGSGSSSEETPSATGGSTPTHSPGAAIRLAQNLGAPVLAGGMMALFGMAL
ncbi:hypothetical protein BU23DRAFT_555948 [Bimuria novae-zelandiae CBS 107.79]|uniref:DUF7707 domain-containing protein n=1 Tax=Bimuria novae-zelandiae CBS 107.79 TaxID=1447943 RepID=A0A6A5VDV2_9PLEO|nr:hypothetical protein BU23DRAFT_555948 [Bimuria novae-zelandiae CBS 107.79]